MSFQSFVLLLEANNFLCDSPRSSDIQLNILRHIVLKQPIVVQSEAPCLSLRKAVHALGKGIVHDSSPDCFFQLSAVHRFPEITTESL